VQTAGIKGVVSVAGNEDPPVFPKPMFTALACPVSFSTWRLNTSGWRFANSPAILD
jgi:hypothetical protein